MERNAQKRRRLSELINLRTDPSGKEKFKNAAKRDGFTTLSAWAMDRLLTDGGMSLQERRILSGRLGRLMAPLRKLAREGGTTSPETLTGLLRLIDAEIVVIQKMILKGGSDAGEGDPEPQVQT